MKKTRTILVGIGLLFSIHGLLAAGESIFSFALKGGYALPSSKTLNEGIIAPANALLQDFRSFLTPLGFEGSLKEGPKISGGFNFGGEIQIRVLKSCHLALGIESFQGKSKGWLEGTCGGMYDGTASDLRFDSEYRASFIKIYGTVRFYFPLGKWRGYAGGGAGFTRAKISLDESYAQTVNGIDFSSGVTTDGQSTKILPHINGGVEMPLFGWLKLCADFQYVIGTIKNFELTDDSERHPHVGKTLTYWDAQGIEKEFVWELSGFQAGLFLRISF